MAKILIIEDDTDINNMIAEYLSERNMEVEQAFSGTEGKLLWQMNPFDLKQALCTFYETNLHGQIDYVEILSYPDLKPISTLIGQTALVAVAYKYSKARLIDNVLIQGGKETK